MSEDDSTNHEPSIEEEPSTESPSSTENSTEVSGKHENDSMSRNIESGNEDDDDGNDDDDGDGGNENGEEGSSVPVIECGIGLLVGSNVIGIKGSNGVGTTNKEYNSSNNNNDNNNGGGDEDDIIEQADTETDTAKEIENNSNETEEKNTITEETDISDPANSPPAINEDQNESVPLKTQENSGNNSQLIQEPLTKIEKHDDTSKDTDKEEDKTKQSEEIEETVISGEETDLSNSTAILSVVVEEQNENTSPEIQGNSDNDSQHNDNLMAETKNEDENSDGTSKDIKNECKTIQSEETEERVEEMSTSNEETHSSNPANPQPAVNEEQNGSISHEPQETNDDDSQLVPEPLNENESKDNVSKDTDKKEKEKEDTKQSEEIEETAMNEEETDLSNPTAIPSAVVEEQNENASPEIQGNSDNDSQHNDNLMAETKNEDENSNGTSKDIKNEGKTIQSEETDERVEETSTSNEEIHSSNPANLPSTVNEEQSKEDDDTDTQEEENPLTDEPQNKLGAMKDEADKLCQLNSELTEKINDQKAKNKELEEEMNSLKEELAELSETKEGLEIQMNEHHNELEKLKSEKEELVRTNEDLKSEVETLNTNKKGIEGEMEKITNEINELNKSKEGLETQMFKQHNELEKLKPEKDNLAKINEDLKLEIEIMNAVKKGIEDEAKKIINEINELNNIKEGLKTQLNEQHNEQERLKSEKEELVKTNEDLKSEIETLNRNKKDIEVEKEKIMIEINELNNFKEGLKIQLNEQHIELEKLKSEKEDLMRTNEDLKSETETLNTDIKKNEDKKGRIIDEINQLKSEEEKINEVNNSIRAEIANQQIEVKKLEDERRTTMGNIEKTKEIQNRLRGEFENLKKRTEKLKSSTMITVVRKTKGMYHNSLSSSIKDTDVYCEKCQKIYCHDSVLFGEHYRLYKNTHNLIEVRNKEAMQNSIMRQLNEFRVSLIANRDRDLKMFQSLEGEEKRAQDELDKVFSGLHKDINKKRELTLAAMGTEELAVGKGIFERIESVLEGVSKYDWEGDFILNFLEIVGAFEKYKHLPEGIIKTEIKPIYDESTIKAASEKISEISIGAIVAPLISEEKNDSWDNVRISSTHCNDLLEAECKEAWDDDTHFAPIYSDKNTIFDFTVPHPGSCYMFRARVRKGDFVSGWSLPLTVQTKRATWKQNDDFELSGEGAIATYKGNNYGDVCTLPVTYTRGKVGIVRWSISIENTKKSFIFIGIADDKKELMLCCRDGKLYHDPRKPSTMKYASDVKGLKIKSEVVVVLDYENNSLYFEINGNSYGHASRLYDDDATDEDIGKLKLAATLTSRGDSIKLNDVEIKPPN